MFEYQINVSRNGKHVFRTDWMRDREAGNKAYSALMNLLSEGYELNVHRRSPVMVDGVADLI